mgnify:FL=1
MNDKKIVFVIFLIVILFRNSPQFRIVSRNLDYSIRKRDLCYQCTMWHHILLFVFFQMAELLDAVSLEIRTQSYNISSRHNFNLSMTEILDRRSVWQKTEFLHLSELIFACVTPVIIIVGLVGNGLSLAVFTSNSLRKLTASTYLTALSLADLSTLVFYVTIEWLRRGLVILNPDARLNILDASGVCQVLLYFAYLSRFMSSWVIVVFTVERFTGICHPLRSFKRGGKRVLLTILCVACVIVLYKPGMTISTTMRGRVACKSNPAVPEIVSYALDVVFALSITIIPFIIITVLNILICRALYLRNRDGSLFSEDANTRIRLEFTLILVAISFFFIAFNLPYTIVWSRYFLKSHPEYNQSSFREVDNEYWISVLNITRTVFYINYCVNFFLYSITGRCFRKTLVGMLKCTTFRHRRSGSYIRCHYMGSASTHATIVCKYEMPTKSGTSM